MPRALRAIEAMPKPDRLRVRNRIDGLAAQPRPPGSIKLSGHANLYRVRVGDYRIIYELHDDRRIVIVIIVANRRESYRGGL